MWRKFAKARNRMSWPFTAKVTRDVTHEDTREETREDIQEETLEVADEKEDKKADTEEEFLKAAKNGDLTKIKECFKSKVDFSVTNTKGLSALHLSAREGHSEIVRLLLKKGANIHAITQKLNTPLHIASLGGHIKVVEIFLEHGAGVNLPAQYGITPLYMAAQENHTDVAKLLLKYKANPHIAAKGGFEPANVAIQQGHPEMATLLLEYASKRGFRALHVVARRDDRNAASLLLQAGHDPNITAPNGYSPLHIAAKYGSLNVAHLLIESGANVNALAKNKVSPLHVAAKHGQTHLVIFLIEADANLNATTKDGLTPLHCASREGHEHAVEILLVHGTLTEKTKHGLTALHMAAQGNHVNCANHLLGHGAHIDAETSEGVTPLHVAAHYGHVPMAQLLLDRGADIDKTAKNGYAALHVASKKNREPVVQLLLKYGASVHLKNNKGQTSLHVATYFGNVKIVLLLIQHHASIEVTTVTEETILHIACRTKQITIVRLLLRNNANVNPRSRDEETPLHMACRQNSPEIVSLLLDSEADPDAPNKEHQTALHIASRNGNKAIVETLLDHGANVSVYTKRGFSPLHETCKEGHTQIAKMLLDKNIDVDSDSRTCLTPLHICCHYKNLDAAILLLENGANSEAIARNGFTPLHIASKKNGTELATILLDRGVDPDKTTRHGVSPLHLAAKEGNEKIVDILLEHGASPGIQTKNGLTPLHIAVRYNHIEVVRRLIKFGAPINAQTNSGFTPLYVAAFYGHLEIARLLVQEGADVEARTKKANTPLHVAAFKGHKEIIELLLEHNAPPNAANMDGYTALYIAEIIVHTVVIETLVKVTQVVVKTKNKQGLPSPERLLLSFAAPEDLEETDVIGSADDAEEEVPSPKIVYEDFDETFPGFDESSLYSEQTYQTESIPESPFHTGFLNFSNTDLQDLPIDNITVMEPQTAGGFLISFLVDARGGILESRQSGIRVIVPKGACRMPTRFTCRLCRNRRQGQLPQLNENEAVVSRVMEISPPGTHFLRPVIVELPHFGSLRGRERELIILRNDQESGFWREHLSTRINSDMYDDDRAHEISSPSPEHGMKGSGIQFVRIVTQDIPKRFVIVSRPRKENFLLLPEGGILKAAVDPRTIIEFPDSTINMSTKLLMQLQTVDEQLLPPEEGLHVSPILNLEPFTRLIRPITITIPCRWLITPENQGIPASCLRLVAFLPKEEKRDSKDSLMRTWTDITDRTSLTVVGDDISFVTTFLTKYWVIQINTPELLLKQLDSLLRSVSPVPYIAKFVVFGRRLTADTAELRVLCMTDDKVDKTLELQEGFSEIARSRDLDICDGQVIYLKCSGNMSPAIQNLKLTFTPFRENRLGFKVSSLNSQDPWICRISCIGSLRKDAGGKVPVLCNLEARLIEEFVDDSFSNDMSYQVGDDILQYVARSITEQWIDLAQILEMDNRDIQGTAVISAGNDELAALTMLEMWRASKAEKATYNTLRDALLKLGTEDVANIVDTKSPQSIRSSEKEKRSYFNNAGKPEEAITLEPYLTSEKSPEAQEKPIVDIEPLLTSEKIPEAQEKPVLDIEPLLTSEKLPEAQEKPVLDIEPLLTSEKLPEAEEKPISDIEPSHSDNATIPNSQYHGLTDYVVVDFADQVPEEEQKMIPDEDKIDVESFVEEEIEVQQTSPERFQETISDNYVPVTEAEEKPVLDIEPLLTSEKVPEAEEKPVLDIEPLLTSEKLADGHNNGQTMPTEERHLMEVSYEEESVSHKDESLPNIPATPEVSFEEVRQNNVAYQSTTADEHSPTVDVNSTIDESHPTAVDVDSTIDESHPTAVDVDSIIDEGHTPQESSPQQEILEEESFTETHKADVDFSNCIDNLTMDSSSEASDRTLVESKQPLNQPEFLITSDINSNISNEDSKDSGVSLDITPICDDSSLVCGEADKVIVNGDNEANNLIKEMFAGDNSILDFFETPKRDDKADESNLDTSIV